MFYEKTTLSLSYSLLRLRGKFKEQGLGMS